VTRIRNVSGPLGLQGASASRWVVGGPGSRTGI